VIVRHRFEFMDTVPDAWTDVYGIEYEKHKQLVAHVAAVEDARKAGRKVTKAATFVRLREPFGPYEWVTHLDGDDE
jgi:hypothetical protein